MIARPNVGHESWGGILKIFLNFFLNIFQNPKAQSYEVLKKDKTIQI